MFSDLINNFIGNDTEEQADNLPKLILAIIILSIGIAGAVYIALPHLPTFL